MKINFTSEEPSFFDDLSRADRRKFKRTITDSLGYVASRVQGSIKLPEKMTVGFMDDPDILAEALDEKLRVSLQAKPHLLDGGPILDGLMAHEASHLSDYAAANDCAGDSSQFSRIVKEGKAEKLGVEIGGEAYCESIWSGGLTGVERARAYDVLVGRWTTGVEVDEVSQPAAAEATGKKYSIYAAGYTLITDVMRWTGVESVLDLHAEPLDFFRDTLRAHYRNFSQIEVPLVASETRV